MLLNDNESLSADDRPICDDCREVIRGAYWTDGVSRICARCVAEIAAENAAKDEGQAA